MKPIDKFEAGGMNAEQLIHECWERDFTYQDYVTNCDTLGREPASKQTFHAMYKVYDSRMAANIASRQAKPHDEAQYFRTL